MSNAVVVDWTAAEQAKFRREPVVGRHTLMADPEYRQLFSREALARLIDTHNPAKVDFLTMGRGQHEPNTWKGGSRDGLTGAQILEAVERGRLWINLRNVMNDIPEYAAAQARMYGDLVALNPGFKPRNVYGGILISSPRAQVFYHVDAGEVILWHLEGVKHFYVYPPRAPYLHEETYEGLILNENTEEQPYDPAYEDAAFHVALEPGMFASWPHGGPHRIVNGDTLNVSITTEYSTLETRMRFGAYYANGLIRRHLGGQPEFARMSKLEQAAKFALSLPLQKLRVNKKREQKHFHYFAVDPAAPDCVREFAEPVPRQ